MSRTLLLPPPRRSQSSIMMTSRQLRSASPRLLTAAPNKCLMAPDAPARVRFAAAAAAVLPKTVAVADPESFSLACAKKDFIEGFLASAGANLPARFGSLPAAVAVTELVSSCTTGTKMELIHGCAAAAAFDDAACLFACNVFVAACPPAARLREPCRSNTLADSCFVVAWPFTLANSDLAAESAKRLEAGISVDHLACR
jgi:hypothetical protein